MMNRVLRIVMLLFWLELGLVLILVPWSDVWEVNFFLYQYPRWAYLHESFPSRRDLRVGIHERAVVLGAFRRRTAAVASRT